MPRYWYSDQNGKSAKAFSGALVLPLWVDGKHDVRLKVQWQIKMGH
jgi:hypothetical protein